MPIQVLSRTQIDPAAWDACVSASPQRSLYGCSWYLDALTSLPSWTWVGLVMADEASGYRAVMPVPIRRKVVAGVAAAWVVHQPPFCQFLGVFSRDQTVDPGPFLRVVQRRFRYGSKLNISQYPGEPPSFGARQQRATHVLDLSVGYPAIVKNYSRDRRLNLRRAEAANWIVVNATDPEPLLRLFRNHHAAGISGGVGEWAYALFQRLYVALDKRRLATLRYALRDGQPEAGALFVADGNRITYLFNAASAVGRRGNARTLLIDQVIRENAGRPLLFDFESPEKPSIRAFYESFGAREEPFWCIRWNRLSRVERTLLVLARAVRR